MRYFLMTYSFFLFFSCSNRDKVPADVLSPKKMQSVLWDMLRADQFVATYVVRDTALDKKKESIKLYEQVFRVHHISKEKFKKSVDFYQKRPDLLKVILDSIFNKQRTMMENRYPPRHDSLPNLDSIRKKLAPTRDTNKLQ